MTIINIKPVTIPKGASFTLVASREGGSVYVANEDMRIAAVAIKIARQ